MKLYVWGTGAVAETLVAKNLNQEDIIGFIDTSKKADFFLGKRVYLPVEALGLEYDAIVVATNYSLEIYEQAKKMNFDMKKFVFTNYSCFLRDMNEDYELVSKIFSREYTDYLKRLSGYRVLRSMNLDSVRPQLCRGEGRNTQMYVTDYNRIRTFELVADELGEVPGAVAELGVFRGDFAQYINAAFPDRLCYLFDTFEGFRLDESEKEREAGHCDDAFINLLSHSSEAGLFSKLSHPEKVVIKKGLFPESLGGLEEQFAFVSIDVDFEQAIYDGIVYFYPRLNPGGYIFIHDYNSSHLAGVKRAVTRYEEEYGRIGKVPLPDVAGTLVITKA